jgi:hypothetical protein
MNHSIQFCFILLGLSGLLTTCNRTSSPVVQSTTPSPTVSASAALTPKARPSKTSAATTPKAENQIISPKGIGAAQLGMTLGELKQTLDSDVELSTVSPFIVDFDAIAVRKAGEVQYYILYLAGQTFSDKDIIQGLLTNNSKFRTAEGVGPGTTIAKAEQTYGKVTLSYNTQNESREYARFANLPAGNLSFSTGNGNKSTAGIYASPSGAYNETQRFKPEAAIQSVLVVCLAEDCAQSASN